MKIKINRFAVLYNKYCIYIEDYREVDNSILG